jgi:hypothetical protein
MDYSRMELLVKMFPSRISSTIHLPPPLVLRAAEVASAICDTARRENEFHGL